MACPTSHKQRKSKCYSLRVGEDSMSGLTAETGVRDSASDVKRIGLEWGQAVVPKSSAH